MTLAWFSPLPPSTSGIAAYSAELVPLLRARGHVIHTFTEANAHEFVWRHRRGAYDLTVFQLGNAQCHDYMWAYLFRYPGLVALHDIQLHQARALFLTRRWLPRIDDYIAEVHANHPEAPPDLPYLVIAGMGDRMYQHWPLVKLVVESARLTLVHNEWVADDLKARHPAAHVRAIPMGVLDAGVRPQPEHRRPDIRRQHDIPADAIVIAAFGGVTPEKRIPQVVRAMSAIAERHPRVHLMLVGARAGHYDVVADAEAAGVADRVHVTGYVPDDHLPAYLHEADICACLRWPTNRETSASWLRCLSAGQPTIVTELMHEGDVPTLDPRGWRVLSVRGDAREPIAVSIDPLDEDQSLQLALERLAADPALRLRLGRAARGWWLTHHQLEAMADAYERAIEAARETVIPSPALPPHLLADGTSQLLLLSDELAVRDRVRDLL